MFRIWLSLTIFLILTFNCYSQVSWEGSEYISNGVRQPILLHTSKEETQILLNRWQAIGQELKTTDNILSGTYILDGNRASYLRWSPKNGFVYLHLYEYHLRDYIYGKVEIKDSEITFIPEREVQKDSNEEKYTIQKSWIFIGKYLIPKNEIKDFADYLSGLDKFNEFNCECDAFFSKFSPHKAQRFIIPKQYRQLFRPPIEGKIIYVGKQIIINVKSEDYSPSIVSPVKINVGKSKGIKEGLIFRLPKYGRELIITKVNENNSEGTIDDAIWDEQKGLVATYYDNKTETYKPLPRVRIGTKVTTKWN